MKKLKYTQNINPTLKALWVWDLCNTAYETPTQPDLWRRFPGANFIQVFKDDPDYMFCIRYVHDGQGYLFFVWAGTRNPKMFFGSEGNFNIFPLIDGMFPEGLYNTWMDHVDFVNEMLGKFPEDIPIGTGHSRGSQLAGMFVYSILKVNRGRESVLSCLCEPQNDVVSSKIVFEDIKNMMTKFKKITSTELRAKINRCDYVGFATPSIGTEKFYYDFEYLRYHYTDTCLRVNTVGDIFASNRVDDLFGGKQVGEEFLLPGSVLSRWRIFSRIFRHTSKTYNKTVKKMLKKLGYKPVY